MANKKMTWKNIVAKTPEEKMTRIEVSEEIFAVPAIEVKHTLNMQEMANFVSNVVSMCFDMEKAEYTPEFYSFAMRLNVLGCYAGIALPEGKNGAVKSMVEKAYAVLYGTDLYERVLSCINEAQFEAITRAVDAQISFNRDLITSAAVQRVSQMIERMDGIVSDEMGALDKIDIDGLTQAVSRLTEGTTHIAPAKGETEIPVEKKIIPLDRGNNEEADE